MICPPMMSCVDFYVPAHKVTLRNNTIDACIFFFFLSKQGCKRFGKILGISSKQIAARKKQVLESKERKVVYDQVVIASR
jgi:hypothetical protein